MKWKVERKIERENMMRLKQKNVVMMMMKKFVTYVKSNLTCSPEHRWGPI